MSCGRVPCRFVAERHNRQTTVGQQGEEQGHSLARCASRANKDDAMHVPKAEETLPARSLLNVPRICQLVGTAQPSAFKGSQQPPGASVKQLPPPLESHLPPRHHKPTEPQSTESGKTHGICLRHHKKAARRTG